jgi:hypothetical protein
MKLRIVPVTWGDSCGFVDMWHRHLKAPPGHKFCLGVADDLDVLVGVAITGRPVARMNQDGLTLEVTRTATDGTRNAGSMLYAACWQAAKALGYRRLITYNHARVEGPACAENPCAHESCRLVRLSESGDSLRGAGWLVVAERAARPGWNMPSRPRDNDGYESIPRTLWEAGRD